MPNNGCHNLACDEGCQISTLPASGTSIRSIAEQLNRSPGTISREIQRNSGSTGCWHGKAHGLAPDMAAMFLHFIVQAAAC